MMLADSIKALVAEHASAMPAATWHSLGMNDTRIETPEGLAIRPNVKVLQGKTCGTDRLFDDAMAEAQLKWEGENPAPTAEERAERERYLKAEADATYGGTAQSAYQVRADAIEESRSLAESFEHGVGKEAASYLRDAAGDRIVICANDREHVDAQVTVVAVPGCVSAAAIDVVAGKDSQVSLSVTVDGPLERNSGEATEAHDADPSRLPDEGVAGTTVRVFADEDAQVKVVRMQTLDGGYTDIDDVGLFAAARARIDIRQTVLGATRAYTGLAGDLRGESSQVNVETSYLGREEQLRDFNYSIRHHGPKSQCDLQANGVLTGRSAKTLRGTIDLVRGCKGAQGSENETVLLVDEGVRNKTVPVILCNEDDVAGNHGATIGHIRDEQMFYLASRGFSPDAAQRLFAHAILEQAVVDAPDEVARAAALRMGESIEPGFTELFGEEM